MTTPKIILASTSPTRRALLASTGLSFETRAPDYEEHLSPDLSPKELSLSLALGKAQAASRQDPDEIIIGADQVLDLDGRAIGKYSTLEEAKKGLRALSGRSHFLHTGVALVRANETLRHFVVTTTLQVRSLSNEELDAYAETNEWQGCAGGYRIEGKGVCLFESIEGDYFNILGLPIVQVLSALRIYGVPFWSK